MNLKDLRLFSKEDLVDFLDLNPRPEGLRLISPEIPDAGVVTPFTPEARRPIYLTTYLEVTHPKDVQKFPTKLATALDTHRVTLVAGHDHADVGLVTMLDFSLDYFPLNRNSVLSTRRAA